MALTLKRNRFSDSSLFGEEHSRYIYCRYIFPDYSKNQILLLLTNTQGPENYQVHVKAEVNC